MPVLETFSAVGSVLGGLGGIFGKKPTPRTNMISQARGAREAAEQYGFNPLTMLQYGQPGGLAGGGAPPLASVELLTNGLNNLSAELNGDNARKRQADQLNLDLAKLKLEQARSGVAIVPPAAVNSVGGGSSPLGRQNTVTDFPFPNGTIDVPKPGFDRGNGILTDFFGHLESPPGWTPPAVVEEDQGEIVGWAYGVPYVGAMVGHNVGQWVGGKLGDYIVGKRERVREIDREHDPSKPLSPFSSGFTSVPGVAPWLN